MGEMAVYLFLLSEGKFTQAQEFLERPRLSDRRDAVTWTAPKSIKK